MKNRPGRAPRISRFSITMWPGRRLTDPRAGPIVITPRSSLQNSMFRGEIAFTNTWYWENFVQYDNVSYSLGLNSILRWVPRAGREMVLVVNREYIDFIREQHFNRVSGDITFKFSYTFRF